jgi:hypothetical protein
MNRANRVRVRHAAALVSTAALLMTITGCHAANNKPGGAGTANSPSSPSGAQSELPFTLDGMAAAVAVTDKGVYVADTGQGNEINSQGYSFTSDDGRLLLLEPGATAQKEVATKLGAPISLAAGPDGSVYVIARNPSKAERFSSGSSEPTPLPFTFGESISDPAPRKIAVTQTGDVVLLTDQSLQLLPKSSGVPKELTRIADDRFLAVDPKGAIYFADGFDNTEVIDSGSTEPKDFEQPDKTQPTKQTVAMAFDTNGDRYTLYESCGPGQPDGQTRPCNVTVFTLSKFTSNSGTPTDIPVSGLSAPTSVAVGPSGIYITDGKRVVKITK